MSEGRVAKISSRFLARGEAGRMARHEHLPIYKKAMDLAFHME